MKRILILGASGMAGHVVYTYLSEQRKYIVKGTTNANEVSGLSLKMNIFNESEIDKIIREEKPDFIINCIGMLIRTSRSNPAETIYGNAYFPHLLRDYAAKYNARLIHISTDCVFSGKTGSYTEDSFKDAADIYGLSKNLGEIIDTENVTVRTSIIGPELKQNGEGLFHWFMQQKGAVTGFKNNFWSGVTTLELAKFVGWVIDNNITGLVHLTNNQSVSKDELLHIFNDVYNKDLLINNEKDYVSNKSFLNTRDDIKYDVPPYRKMLEEQKVFIWEHKENYADFYLS